MTKRNERTSARVARIAGRVLAYCKDAKPSWVAFDYGNTAVTYGELRALAASALTQAEDNPKTAKQILAAELRANYPKPRRRARRK